MYRIPLYLVPEYADSVMNKLPNFLLPFTSTADPFHLKSALSKCCRFKVLFLNSYSKTNSLKEPNFALLRDFIFS